jgi:energy-coupling factor transporter ATP-binding protein EcfA2
MLREEEIKRINENLKRKKSTLIYGREGIGKTWILLHLKGIYVEYPGMKLILETIVKSMNIQLEKNIKYLTVVELLGIVKPYLNKVVILVDEFGDARIQTIKLIKKLITEGATIVAASNEKKHSYLFRESIEIKPLSRLDSEYLLYHSIKSIDNLSADIIISKSLGYPGKILELARAYEIGIKNLDINPSNTKSIINFFSELPPQMPERINLLPFEYLFAIGFGLLIIKYIYFGKGDLRTAYFLGGLGYLTLIIWRAMQKKR